MRQLLLPTAVCVLVLVTPHAAAQTLSEPIETRSVLDTAVAIPGDGWSDPTSLVVTDEQLLDAGSTTVIQSLHEDPQLIIVDDDFVQCPNAHANSIQEGVALAPPDGFVRVCPGFYNENVFITKPLTVQAPRHRGQATRCNEDVPADSTEEAIIEGDNPAGAVQLLADDIELNGFTVQNNQEGPGVFSSALFSGYRILHNTIQDNVFGLYFNSNGAFESVAEHNCFRDNVVPGAAASNGVYSDQNLDNARIQDNYFTGHHNAAIILTHTTGVNDEVEITHNDSVDDSSIALFRTTNVVVNYNKVIRPDGSALFIGGAVESADISFNHVEALVGVTDGSGNGVSLNEFFGTTENLVVKSNKIIGMDGNGVLLESGVTDVLVETNRAVSNGLDGIRATSGAVDNIIKNNHLRENQEHDCHDDSTGPHNPPALVANQWINDFGLTENREGLCKRATLTP